MRYRRIAPLLVALAGFHLFSNSASAQRQMENLGRGVVAVRTNSTRVYVGWRMLGTDPADIGYNLYRITSGATNQLNGAQPLTVTTEFVDTPPSFAIANAYFVRPVLNGIEQPASAAFTLPANPPTQQYLSVQMQIPPGGTSPPSADGDPGGAYSYSANDCSVGDLDGDGEYEIVVKWEPSNAKDNSQDGHTGPVYLDGYRLDGTRLWRINLGKNIRAGAHYTQFMVFDLDGDGRAEVACKTAPGTVDGLGAFVRMSSDNPNTIYTNSNGYILSGPEYQTVFDGLTGAALVTTNYLPARGSVSSWGDSYGNRVDRFLACIAYLDGVRPSLVMCRGYYTRAVLVAWDWRDGQLTRRWTFDSNSSGNGGYEGQGNHNLSVADLDGDGKDEIVYGACAIDDNGARLHTTGLGHGDALHVSDMDPDRPGLEIWGIHEPSGVPGADLRDGRTGQAIFTTALNDGEGPGRGVAADVWAGNPGYEMWGAGGLRDRYGNKVGRTPGSANFLVWWDADPVRELLNSNVIDKYGTSSETRLLTASGASSNNGTKSTPCLSADILGDWREEVIWRASDSSALRIYTTIIRTTNRFTTLMHDPQYRAAIAWQNVAYNQPPHPGFFLGAGMLPQPQALVSDAHLVWRGQSGTNWDEGTTANWFTNGLWISNTTATVFNPGDTVLFDMTGSNSAPVNLNTTLAPGRVKVHAPKSFTFSGAGGLAGTMNLIKAGTGLLTINTTNSFTGPTLVSEGGLFVHGSLDQSPVTAHGSVWGTRVGGHGILGAGLTLRTRASLMPGNGTNNAGTLTLSNALSELGGVINHFDLSDDPTGTVKPSDLIQVFGNVTLTGVNTVQVHQVNGSLAAGIYPLIKHTGTLNGSLANLALAGTFTKQVSLTNLPGQIALVARDLRANITNVSHVPGGLILTGSGGPPNATFHLLNSTNLLSPLNQWTRIATNQFGATGEFTVTNPPPLGSSPQFFAIQGP